MTEWMYFYTPMCGTCKLAERFIDLAEHLPGAGQVMRRDINEYSELAQKWQITSVPCLIRIAENKPVDRIYAFHDVPHVYQFLKNSR
ncbi:thioredoxin family protein [Alkalicoccus luteus]|uniref:Thioredoxin family protein n=1 Tax=Alkalicoccus luteus TaxID=1237094 RepID=A0A969TW75_9BACI|nr:thioredoxin family protein [Alkalicoccus luteus]NJP38887.1 thioredoxin family protein [Alkalicoccus luteus]